MTQTSEKVTTYLHEWLGSFALLLTRLSSGSWQVQAEDTEVAAEVVPIAYFRVETKGALAGQQWFGFAAKDVTALLGIFLGEEVTLTDHLDGTQTEALEELVRQWSGLVATALRPMLGELSFEVSAESDKKANGECLNALRITDGPRTIDVMMQLDSSLLNALRDPEAAVPSSVPSHPAASPSPSNPPSRVEELLRQGNLDLLMDVELAVTLRFGSRQATLQEVLDLATGAVLELDREIQEPVDLLLNNRVIARGEVVVIDGNYGLRVTEVASPQQRVNSL